MVRPLIANLFLVDLVANLEGLHVDARIGLAAAREVETIRVLIRAENIAVDVRGRIQMAKA